MGWKGKALDFITGGAGSKVLKIADDAIDTSAERRQDDAADLSSARAMQVEGHTAKLVQLYNANTAPLLGFFILLLILLDVLVDAAARLVRPWVTIHLLGAFFGYWSLRQVNLTPFQEAMVYLVFTFWFGGRAIMRDIPKFLVSLRKFKK